MSEILEGVALLLFLLVLLITWLYVKIYEDCTDISCNVVKSIISVNSTSDFMVNNTVYT